MTLKMVQEHMTSVFLAVCLMVAAGIPLGISVYFFKRLKAPVLWIVEILQTIPSMALLGFVMIFLGPGTPTVVIGLFLYSLLPIVQNTYLGLSEVDPAIKDVANGMGMTRIYRLIHVEIPIAFPYIFTGIRIATVTSVGVAIFARNVGGGGIGRAIYQGIRAQNMSLIFSSTLTLMAIAIGLDTIMTFIEKYFYKRMRPSRNDNVTQRVETFGE
jgi:ABC-type proline/glycine betaine transport systems, permease component